MRTSLSTLLLAVFLLPVFMPFASAAGMAVCTANGGTCDQWNKAHDGSPNQQDWIEGVYEFDLVDTSTINMEMTWALREFNRSILGLDDSITANALLFEGLSAQDGAPADMIRNFFDEQTGGAGTPTVKDKLVMEVNNTIRDLLGSGFGAVSSIGTTYTNSINNAGVVTTCTDDPDVDTQDEAGLENNVFDPPICFSVQASVSLSTSTFNLGTVDPLTLERVYQGMLVMGADVTTGFSLFSNPGHSSSFVINPPSYATVKGTDSTGIPTVRAGPPSYMAAEWTIDHTDAALGEDRIERDVSLNIGHRNSTQTKSVEIGSEEKGLDLRVTLDLSDESSAWIEVVAGVHHLDESTMVDWGVSLVDVTENATVPWVTADGIRMAYQNGLIELDTFTENFPMDLIGDAVSSAVPSGANITMNQMNWVSDSTLIGIEPGGGLNYSHQACPETLPPGTAVNYCIEGPNAMDGYHPIYLRSYSNNFDLHLLDIFKQQVSDDTGTLSAIREEDLRMLLESGLSIETKFGQDLLQDMIPENMPPTDLTLELILPQWMQAATGNSSIILIKRSFGEDQLDISMSSPNGYDPRHAILDSDGKEICSGHETDWSCVNFILTFDVSEVDFNEWGPSAEVTVQVEAQIDIYRLKIPLDVRDGLSSGDTIVDLAVIPSDLLRLGIDISTRMSEPHTSEIEIGDGEVLNFSFTRPGLERLVDRMGQIATETLHEEGDAMSDQDEMAKIDFSGIQIVTELKGLGGMGTTIEDQTPISLNLKIPEFTVAAGVSNGWGGITGGNPEIGLTTALYAPMLETAQAFSQALTQMGSQFLAADGGGLTLDNDGEAMVFPIESTDMTIVESADLDLRGDFTITMPEGITLKNFQTANGYETVTTEDGRQQITISLKSFAAGDEFSFSLNIGWGYIIGQIWAYPAIIIGLIIWRIWARKKKKARKRAASETIEFSENNMDKGGLSDSDFTNLGVGQSSGYDPSGAGLYDDNSWSNQ